MSKEKCPFCTEVFKQIEGLQTHIEREHEEQIPKSFSSSQYVYFLKTGKDHGNCVICHKPTTWNLTTNKYNRFCPDPKCKAKYIEEFRKRMIGKYGKITLLDSPEHQKKMLANRKISGVYKWDNETETTYTGSYELDFIKLLDTFLDWDSSDIIAPSPHTYYYNYEGEQKFYMPDFFIPSLNLEIEIKDGGDNQNKMPKIQAVDKVKEKLKDEVLLSQNVFSYIKIVNKEYGPFFKLLFQMKENYLQNDKLIPIFVVNKSYEHNEVVEKDLEPISESFLISESDLTYNLEKWGKSENILFITGLSGSGKSTLAKQLAKYNSCSYFKLDYAEDMMIRKYGREKFVSLTFEEYCQKIFEFVEDKFKDTKKVIVEGIQILDFDYNKLVGRPLIIKGTSMMKSTFQALKRESSLIDAIRDLKTSDLKGRVKINLELSKLMKQFKSKLVKESYENIESTNDDLEPISESFLVSDNDLIFNFNNWKKEPEKNILFITGISGSGKSTLSHKYASNYSAEVFELDGFEANFDHGQSKFLYKYKTLYPKIGEMIDTGEILKVPEEVNITEYEKFIHWLIREMHKSPNKLFIIEGSILFEIESENLKNYPFIIKGTSYLKSTIQRIERGNDGKINLKILYDEIFKNNAKRFKNNFHYYEKLNAYKNNLELPKLMKQFKSKLVNESYINTETITDNLEPLCESLIFSGDDIIIHLEDWRPEKDHNILYLTGHSGSGKTTMGEQLSIKYRAILIQLDLFEFKKNLFMSIDKNKPLTLGEQLIYNYFHIIRPDIENIDLHKLKPLEFHKEFIDFFMYLDILACSDPNNLYIFEGIQIHHHFEGPMFSDQPFIIKGTSTLTSYTRRVNREDNTISWFKMILNEIKRKGKRAKFYLANEKSLEKFKSELTNKNWYNIK